MKMPSKKMLKVHVRTVFSLDGVPTVDHAATDDSATDDSATDDSATADPRRTTDAYPAAQHRSPTWPPPLPSSLKSILRLHLGTADFHLYCKLLINYFYIIGLNLQFQRLLQRPYSETS